MKTPLRKLSCTALAALFGGVLSLSTAHAANFLWSSVPASSNWNNTLDWTNVAVPATGDSLEFSNSITTVLTNDIAAATSFAGITFDASPNAYTFNGNAITLAGNIANNSTNLETINLPIATTAVRTITMTTGGGNVTLGGNISGTGGGLALAGTGVLTLSGTNSYTSNTTVNATGTLVFQGSSAMSSSSALSTTNGSTLSLLSDSNATFTAASFAPANASTITLNVGPVSTGSSNSLTFNHTAQNQVGGSASTAMTFNVSGSSGDRLILSGGGLIFSANFATQVLDLKPTTANLTVSDNITSQNNRTGTLKLDGTSANNIYSGNIANGAGTLAVTKLSTSTWTLTGTNTYSGTTSISGGTLVYQGASAMSPNSSLSPSAGGTISLLSDTDATFTSAGFAPPGGSTLTLNVGPVSTGSSNSLTLSSTAISPVGSTVMTFNVTGSSGDRLILSGGDINFVGGTGQGLILNPTTANLTVTKNISDPNSGGAALLTLSGTSASNLFSGNISNSTGTVSVTKSSSSTWTLSGTNNYTGLTTIGAGTLIIGGTGDLGSGTYTANIANSGSFVYASSVNQTLGGVISGTGSLTQSGAGTLTLTNANTYTGKTTIAAGTLGLGSTGSLASTNINLGTSASQGTFDISSKSAYTLTNGQTLAGYGLLKIGSAGAGTLTLNGNLAPAVGGTLGNIQVNGNLTLGSTAVSTLTINTNGTAADAVSVTNALTYNGTLDIVYNGSTSPIGTFNLFTAGSYMTGLTNVALTGSWNPGSFTNVSTGVWQDTTPNEIWNFNEANGQLSVSAVPEPSTWALFALSGLVLVVVSRRRKASQ